MPDDPVSLREYLDTRIDTLDRLLLERHQAQETAIAQAAAVRDRKDHDTNNWREQYAERERELIPRREAVQMIDSLKQQIDTLETQARQDIATLREKDSSRSGAENRTELTLLYVISCLGPLIGVIGIVVAITH